MREKTDYRENLRRLDERFPDSELLTLRQITEFTGLDGRTAKRVFERELINAGTPKRASYLIAKTKLARLIS